MKVYQCEICNHIHDEAVDGAFAELDKYHICPECGCGKEEYQLVE